MLFGSICHWPLFPRSKSIFGHYFKNLDLNQPWSKDRLHRHNQDQNISKSGRAAVLDFANIRFSRKFPLFVFIRIKNMVWGLFPVDPVPGNHLKQHLWLIPSLVIAHSNTHKKIHCYSPGNLNKHLIVVEAELCSIWIHSNGCKVFIYMH